MFLRRRVDHRRLSVRIGLFNAHCTMLCTIAVCALWVSLGCFLTKKNVFASVATLSATTSKCRLGRSSGASTSSWSLLDKRSDGRPNMDGYATFDLSES